MCKKLTLSLSTVVLAGSLFAQTIDTLSDTTATRSGMVVVTGSNFDTAGELLIDGLPGIVASWTPSEIAGYVPEAARLGDVTVRVQTTGGSSNTVMLNVTDRQQSGRLRWRFRMDALYSLVRPQLATDGTVYVVDVFSRLYALSPDGALKWIARNAGDKGLAVGPDGTIYTGSENDVKAFAPDGTLKWTFVQNPRAFIMLGLTVDSVGNTYGVASSGMGAFSLTPNGVERWRTPEQYRRRIVDYSELAIGPNGGDEQLYWYGNSHTRAVRTSDGGSVFEISAGQPVVSPLDGTVHIGWSAYSPSGQLLWSFTPPVGATVPDVDSAGKHYHVSTGPTYELITLTPNGALDWKVTMPKSVGAPDVDPTRSIVVVGGSNTLDIEGFFQGVSTQSRAIVWEQPLPPEEPTVPNPWTGGFGFNQFQDTRAKFSADGTTAYVVTAIATGGLVRDRCFLNAIDTGAGAPPPPPPAFLARSASIDLVGQNTGYITVTATVKVVDENNAPLPGATLYGIWRTPTKVQKVSGTVSNTGSISFVGGYGKGTYTFTVTNIVKSGYTFDKAGSVLKKSFRM